MKLEVDENGDIVLSEVYNGIGIKTDVGIFGIAQRDGGIEVMLGGEFIFALDINGIRVAGVNVKREKKITTDPSLL